jgi:glycosyltransferase involved in cell wall biosynthesis
MDPHATGSADAPPRFSVVIPTFDRGRWLVEAIDSVLAQDQDDFELIVVDDGSTDDTADLVRPYLERLTYVRRPNRGAASARNAGIALARGAIVGFLDSDDRWEPRTLTEVAATFDRHPDTGLVAIMAREVDLDGSPGVTYGKRSAGDRYSTESLLLQDAGGCSWYFVRRELLEEVGGFDESLSSAEECDLALRLSLVAPLRAVREPLLLRRRHADNLSLDQTENARCWLRLLDKLGREHPEFVREHPRTYRRAVAKEKLRLARERLAVAGADPGAAGDARRLLRESLATYPFYRRGLTYLAWAWIAPRTYGRWRRRELRSRKARAVRYDASR